MRIWVPEKTKNAINEPEDSLVEFLRRSPLAQAVADGAFGEKGPATAELFPRPADPARDITFG